MGEPAYLTTRELAELLRIKERKVYDLASSGSVPHTKAMGKLLFPRAEVERWLSSQAYGVASPYPSRPPVMLGSHDPVLEWALRESRCGIAALFDGSQDGLDRFARGEGIAAGMHIMNESDTGWNVGAVSARLAASPVVLMEWAKRRRGLITAHGAPLSSFADLRGAKVMLRQKGSGTQTLFARLLAEAGLGKDDFEICGQAGNETEAATAVLEGKADVSFALEDIARRYKLGFTPVAEERFDLLVDRKAWFDPPMQTFLSFCRSAPFVAYTGALTGYDFGAFGTIHLNGG